MPLLRARKPFNVPGPTRWVLRTCRKVVMGTLTRLLVIPLGLNFTSRTYRGRWTSRGSFLARLKSRKAAILVLEVGTVLIFWIIYVFEQSPIMTSPSYSSLNNPGVLLSYLHALYSRCAEAIVDRRRPCNIRSVLVGMSLSFHVWRRKRTWVRQGHVCRVCIHLTVRKIGSVDVHVQVVVIKLEHA